MPKISIAMPVFNCRQSLEPAVNSMLAQDFTDWELLILDDGSRDGTTELARCFGDARIRVFSDGHNRGLAARLNEAARLARGEFMARMDGDDIAFPDRLSRQLDYLLAHPAVDLVGGGALVFDSAFGLRGRRMPPEAHVDICARPWSGFPMLHPSFMGRTAWFRAHPYDASLPRAQDQVLLANSCVDSRFANIQGIVLAYREDAPSFSRLLASRRSMLRGLFAAYMRQGHAAWAWRAAFAQLLRMLADGVAGVLPLRALQLRLRNAPVCAEDQRLWQALQDSLAFGGNKHA